MQTVKEPKLKAPMGENNRCRDYDDDCDKVDCKVGCWLYAPEQGWCPYLKGAE